MTPPQQEYVSHPRFGANPRLTDLDPRNSAIRTFFHWHSPEDVRIFNTAVEAEITKQRPATIHVTHYFDSERICRDCRRKFLFFALEQKHWYEILKFPLEADAIRCCECRKEIRYQVGLHEKYDRLVNRDDLTHAELRELLSILLDLIEQDVFTIRQLQHARELFNRLKKASLTLNQEQVYRQRFAALSSR